MEPDETPAVAPGRSRAWWAGVAGLAVLPAVVAVLGFYAPVFGGSGLPNLDEDFAFYTYQVAHAGEVGGLWWRVGEDDRVGAPYQTEVARHPGLFEGVDLMALCAAPARLVGPGRLYHVAALLVFVTNGWAAGWLVYRKTRSFAWAAAGAVLVTTAIPTMGRVFCGHLHLGKQAFVLLAVWAFSNYLEAPTRRRGVWLGLALAGVLQGSFYLGYLLGLALAVWWLGCLVAGRVGRGHAGATVAAASAFAAAAAALTFPVWTLPRSALLTDGYFERVWGETWFYGGELWQLFLPDGHPLAEEFIAQTGKGRQFYGDGWNFPGYTALAAAAVYAFARLRGFRFPRRYAALLDVLMGVSAVAVVLSLSGGPSFFLFHVFPSFRSYGRAGSIAVAATCAAAPLVLHGALAAVRPRAVRLALAAGAVALLAGDALRPTRYMDDAHYRQRAAAVRRQPQWVGWLAAQPAGVRLAAFPPKVKKPFYEWGVEGLRGVMTHRHATLNGCDFTLLNADLKLLGASYDRLNPRALRFLVSLGYEALAFHDGYLDANPWLRTHPGLDWGEALGPWRIARARPALPRLPRRTLAEVIAAAPAAAAPAPVPPGAWVTGAFDLDADVVVPDRARVTAAWFGPDGKPVAAPAPAPALFQHVFGPGVPAYTVRTPDRPGRYDLVFLRSGRRLAARPYRVDAGLATTRGAFGAAVPAVTLNDVSWASAPGAAAAPRLVLENTSRYYLQSQADRASVPPSIRSHPGAPASEAGAVGLWFHAEPPAGGGPGRDVGLPLPHDLPPGGRLTLQPPADLFPGDAPLKVALTPVFLEIGQKIAPADRSEVRLTVAPSDPPPPALATPATRTTR